jgi:divalent metal cation (Fe/Co/Zn/Cd) transporter
MADQTQLSARSRLIRRGKQLEYATIGYNTLEGIASIIAGAMAGSIALIGFGVDSLIEVTSGAALLWRLHGDVDPDQRERRELLTLRIVGICFLALAMYVAVDSVRTLIGHHAPEHSIAGIVITLLSLMVMPVLARAKRRVGSAINSRALIADSKQTDLCVYLSAITVGGLLLNALLNWWWADPLAALVMVPIIGKEGIEALRGEGCSDDECHEEPARGDSPTE